MPNIIYLFFILGILVSPATVLADPDQISGKRNVLCGDVLDVAVHQSFIRKTAEEITRVSVADPEIADAELLAPKEVLIKAKKKTGTTALTLWHRRKQVGRIKVRVHVPQALIDQMQTRIQQIPGALVNVRPAKDGILLDGGVKSREVLDWVLSIVNDYVHIPPDHNLIIVHGRGSGDFARPGGQIDVPLHTSFVKQTEWDITRVSIADPTIADVQLLTPKQVLIMAKEKTGTTSLTLWHKKKPAGNDREMPGSEAEYAEVYDVWVYVPGLLAETIDEQIQRLAAGSRVNVIRTGNGGVLLDGVVESQEMLARVLSIVSGYVKPQSVNNLITIQGSQQVQLDVKIAEVSRSGMKKMGLSFLNNKDWTIGMFPSGEISGSASTLRYSGSASGGTGSGRALESIVDITSPFSSAFQVALHAVGDDTLGILSLLKGQGLSRILASPSLVAMSGQEANFLVGGEYPYPVQGQDGATNIEYKTFGVMLRFTPTVVGKETITIQVEPEVSSLDFSINVTSGGASVPGLRTRRGSTTLQLKDGQTFAMAGLLNEETSTVINKIPFLGDIPILGSLFTSKEFQKNESELVIIVTPRLVRAMNRDEVPKLPGEGEKDDPSDMDFFLFNRVQSNAEAASPSARKGLEQIRNFVGETGFSR